MVEKNNTQLQTPAEHSSIRTNPPHHLSVAEAALYIGISQRTLRSIIADRRIQVARLGGRVVLRLEDVDRWIESKLEGVTI